MYTEPVRLVLWDIDGTLVDTSGHGRDAFVGRLRPGARPARDAGGHHDVGPHRPLDRPRAARVNGEPVDDERLPEIFTALNGALDARREGIARDGRVMPGVPEVIAALGARDDVAQSLLTGNIEPNAHVKLAALGLDGLLDMEIGGYGSDSGIRPELVDIARRKARDLRGLEVAAPDTVLIGDTPLDVHAAHQNGARAVAVATGRYTVQELLDTGADAVLPDASDVNAAVTAILG